MTADLCACRRDPGDRARRTGRCRGRDSHGIRCTCPSYEAERLATEADEQAAHDQGPFQPATMDPGGKAFMWGLHVWALVGNYMPVDELRAALPGFPWSRYADVTLIDYDAQAMTKNVCSVP